MSPIDAAAFRNLRLATTDHRSSNPVRGLGRAVDERRELVERQQLPTFGGDESCASAVVALHRLERGEPTVGLLMVSDGATSSDLLTSSGGGRG
jgi:hypothetical protein